MKTLLTILSLIVLSITATMAASYTWNGGSGDWSVAGNWTPMTGPPGPGDTATINSGTVTVGADTTVLNLNFTSATITGAMTLTVTGTLNWQSGGTMSGLGRTVIASGATANATGNVGLTLGRTLENAGLVVQTGAAGIYAYSGSVVSNRVEGVWEIRNDQIFDPGGASGRFDNAGLLLKTNSAGTTTFHMPLNNYGTLEVRSGTLAFISAGVLTHLGTLSVAAGAILNPTVGGSASGPINVDAGGLLNWSGGTFQLNAGAQLNGAGLYQLSGGTLTLNTDVSVANLTLGAATINGAGAFTVTGVMNWQSGGTMSGSGKTVIASGATANATGNVGLTLGRTLENAGLVVQTGAAGVYAYSGSVVSNRVEGVWEIRNDQIFDPGGASGRFDNAGLLLKTNSAGTTIFDMPMNNYGTVKVESGTLLARNGALTNYGTAEVRSGILQINLTYAQYSGLTLLAGGNIVNSSPLLIIGGVLSGVGTISGGVNNVGGEVNPGASPGLLTITGNYTQSAGGTLSIEIAGTTPGTSFDKLAVGGTATLDGVLSVDLTNGFYPAPNDIFTILTAGSRSGSFANFYYPSNDVGMAVSNTVNSVFVKVINVRPVIPAISDQIIDEETLLSLMVNATDADTPMQTLTHTLTNSPLGAMVNGSGQIEWMPMENQGPAITNITVRVTDNGTPNLSVTRTFQVTVNEINVAPVLMVPADQTLDEQTPLSVSASAIDPDDPANGLRYALVAPPAGMTIDAATGLIDWTPDETQGPNTYTIKVSVTDTNLLVVNEQNISVTNLFMVTVNESNRPPVVSALANYTVNAGQTIGFTATATDPDLPANTLMFSLISPPTGATIDGSGLFNWRAPAALADTTNTIQVRVMDNGVPDKSGTNSFTVIINPIAPLTLTPVSYAGGQFTFSVTGPLGPDYVIMVSTDLVNWTDLETVAAPTPPFNHTDVNAGMFGERFYQVRLSP